MSTSTQAPVTLSGIRGDTLELVVEVTLKGAAYQITTDQITLTIRTETDGEVLAKLTRGDGIDILDAALGKILATLSPEITSTFPVKTKLPFDVEVVTPANQTYTVVLGTINFQADVTHA